MESLVTHHFLFTNEVVSPLELDEHSGAALRGNFFEAVWRRFCNNRGAESCAVCPLHSVCPVSALVAPLREEYERGRDIPRPYIILPPLEARRYEPGEKLVFGMTLFGKIVELFPYIIMASHTLEAIGLGRRLEANKGQRGRFKIKRIESYHPMTTERQILYQEGKARVDIPMLSVSTADVCARARALPGERLTINFLTPTRILFQEKLVHHAAFRPLILRLSERLAALKQVYGDMVVQEDQRAAISRNDLDLLAKEVECVEDSTCWDDLHSYSRRLQRATPIGGIQGKATFAGDLAPFRELLVWGELIHVGKNTVKGNGWYRIED
jgi:hypothetical protein